MVSVGSSTGHHSDIIQHGYIIANGYSGQQGSGVRALVSLQCWASSFSLPVYIVEPYIVASSLAGRLKSKDLAINNLAISRFLGEQTPVQTTNRLQFQQWKVAITLICTFKKSAGPSGANQTISTGRSMSSFV